MLKEKHNGLLFLGSGRLRVANEDRTTSLASVLTKLMPQVQAEIVQQTYVLMFVSKVRRLMKGQPRVIGRSPITTCSVLVALLLLVASWLICNLCWHSKFTSNSRGLNKNDSKLGPEKSSVLSVSTITIMLV